MLNTFTTGLLKKIKSRNNPMADSPIFDVIKLYQNNQSLFLKETYYLYQVGLLDPKTKAFIPHSPELSLPKLEAFCKQNIEIYKSIYASLNQSDSIQIVDSHMILPFWNIEHQEFDWTRVDALKGANIARINKIYLIRAFAEKAKLQVNLDLDDKGKVIVNLIPLDQGD